MSYFYANISYSSKQDDSKIEKLISPPLQKYDGIQYLGVSKLPINHSIDKEGQILLDSEKNSVVTHKIRCQFSKEDQRNDFIKAVNSLGYGMSAQTFLQ